MRIFAPALHGWEQRTYQCRPAAPPAGVLGGLAEFERSLIVARTGEGRERAKARGVRFGRPNAFCVSTFAWAASVGSARE
jgi:hypothetical protein